MCKILIGQIFQKKMTSYSVEERGSKNSTDYKMFIRDPVGNLVSPLHDIPLSGGEKYSIQINCVTVENL